MEQWTEEDQSFVSIASIRCQIVVFVFPFSPHFINSTLIETHMRCWRQYHISLFLVEWNRSGFCSDLVSLSLPFISIICNMLNNLHNIEILMLWTAGGTSRKWGDLPLTNARRERIPQWIYGIQTRGSSQTIDLKIDIACHSALPG